MLLSKPIDRRKLGKIVVGGALGAAVLPWSHASEPQEEADSHANPAGASGIHLSLDIPISSKDEDLLFFKQIGLDTVSVRQLKAEDQTVDGIQRIKKRFADAGLTVHDVDNGTVNGTLPDIVLNTPDRDKGVEAYKDWVRILGKAGIPMIESIMYNATASLLSGTAHPRGGTGREFDQNSSDITGAPWRLKGKTGTINAPLLGREYSRDEIEANFTYFMKQLMPVAEEAGVRIPFVPSDPAGIPSTLGVPQLFSTFEECKKSLAIANSPNAGMCFGSGSWLDGGADATGIDSVGFIHYFASKKQLFHVYGRNASSPLPHYYETFIDAGYYDMFKIFRALVDVNYEGVVTLDHNMGMVGGAHTYQAFGIGYERAMLQCAQRGYHI